MYKLPGCSSSEKIEDCIVVQYPLSDIPFKNRGYRNCLLALTAHNHLLRYDLDTGQLLEDVYLSNRYKFRALSWNSEGYTIVARSTHEKITSIARQANISCGLLMVLSVFSIFPLQCIAMMEIHKKIFGRDITDAMISQGVLIIMHQNSILRFYSFSQILTQGKQFPVDLGSTHPAGPFEGIIGSQPNGIPLNIKLSECPDVLFEVKCSENKLTIGGRPWHYIITPPKYHGIFHVYSLKTQNLVKNGVLEMDTLSVEPDKCFFHADDSGRILHIGANEIRVLQLKQTNFTKDMNEQQYELFEQFNIKPTQIQDMLQDEVQYTSSGRAVKRNQYRENGLSNETESIQTVDYEDELDLLVVTTVHKCGDHYLGTVCLYDNDSGKIVKEIQLLEPWKEFCDHVVAFDIDTIIHIVKGPMRRYNIYLYKLDRFIGEDSKFHEKDTDNVRRSGRRISRSVAVQDTNEETELYTQTTVRTSRRTTQRSQSSFR